MERSVLVPEGIPWESRALRACGCVWVGVGLCTRKALMGKRRWRPTQEPASPATPGQTLSHKQLSFLLGSTGRGSESQAPHLVACGLSLPWPVLIPVNWA